MTQAGFVGGGDGSFAWGVAIRIFGNAGGGGGGLRDAGSREELLRKEEG